MVQTSFYEAVENPHSAVMARDLGLDVKVMFDPRHEGRNYLIWVTGPVPELSETWSWFKEYLAVRNRKGEEVSLYVVGDPKKRYRLDLLTDSEAEEIAKNGTPIQKKAG